MTGLGQAAASNPAAKIVASKIGTGKRLSPKEREKQRKQREKEERRRRREERDRPSKAPVDHRDGRSSNPRRVSLSRMTAMESD